MQNLDEKIDLILEGSLSEAPARIGTISARDLLSKNFSSATSEPLDDETASRTGFRSLSSDLRHDVIPDLESGEIDSFLSSLESDLRTHFASEETTSEVIEPNEPKNYKPINVRKTIETIKKVKNDDARKNLRRELNNFLRKNDLTPDNDEDKVYLSTIDSPDQFPQVRKDNIKKQAGGSYKAIRAMDRLSHPKEWSEWYVGYMLGGKEWPIGGPLSYEDALKTVQNIKAKRVKAFVYVSMHPGRSGYIQDIKHPLWIKANTSSDEEKPPSDEERTASKFINQKLKESTINEDKLAEITIDFSKLRKQELNESFLAMFGGWVEHILKSMFGGGYSTLPVQVVGTKRELESFTATIGSEKRYIESARRHGLDHPTTYKNKAKLDVAVKNFERDTGLKWPFK